jgi:uncharacterized surface protein with fasciclin (FAS1) repeats
MKYMYLIAIPLSMFVLAGCSGQATVNVQAPTASPVSNVESSPTTEMMSPSPSGSPSSDAMTDVQISSKKTIPENLSASSDFSLIVQALNQSGMSTTLKGKGPYTVFVPNNAAVGKLQSMTLNDLLLPANSAKLKKVLSYHVVSGKYTSASLKDGMSLKTMEGESLKVMNSQGTWTIVDGQGNSSTVVTSDVVSSNGVIFVIDAVLLPQNL